MAAIMAWMDLVTSLPMIVLLLSACCAKVSTAASTGPSARRTRKLLLNRKEIAKISRALEGAGRTLIPLSLYFKDGYAKVEIAVATGKKDWDKRQTIAERDANREAQRALATRNKGRH